MRKETVSAEHGLIKVNLFCVFWFDYYSVSYVDDQFYAGARWEAYNQSSDLLGQMSNALGLVKIYCNVGYFCLVCASMFYICFCRNDIT